MRSGIKRKSSSYSMTSMSSSVFQFEQTPLPGLWVLHPPVFEDERGFFTEVWKKDRLVGGSLLPEFVQDNHSRSHKGVIRGMHFQWDAPLGKLIRVVRGAAFLVSVDIRKNSGTLGKWFALELSEGNKKQLWAPAGFASGFCALEEPTDVQYKYTAFYNANGESNIRWNDSGVGINWPIEEPILSERDQNALTLEEWLKREESAIFTL